MSIKDQQEKRQKAIKELIITQTISDQNSLVDLLYKKYNITTNQAAVSRDLKYLGVYKRKFKDKMIYSLPEIDINKEILKLAVKNINYNENLIVIKTIPALASFVGDKIDLHEEYLEIIGTLAGENVVFVTPKSTQNIDEVLKKLSQILSFS